VLGSPERTSDDADNQEKYNGRAGKHYPPQLRHGC
jgi:hypothetical protein